MEKQKIYASCEMCGLCWTEYKKLQKHWKPIKCPRKTCVFKTENYDTENHNKNIYFLTIKECKKLS